MIKHILERFVAGQQLNREELRELLEVPVGSREYYELLGAANDFSRRQFCGKAMIFAQIGLDTQPCSVNCRFCSLAAHTMAGKPVVIRTKEEVVDTACQLAAAGVDDLFLMTTAEFSPEAFLEYGRAVRQVLPQGMRLVANVGDFDAGYAARLKEAGFTGVYHVRRLREGVDTGATEQARVRTMDAVRAWGLELYYCVEPIGPEHTNQELVEEMVRGREYPVGVMAVMKRTAVPGTPLAKSGEITAARLAQICAAATLAMRPQRAMCVHEPDELCLMAGANQLYAECGANPRDTAAETEKNRGFSVEDARRMMRNAEWS
ncbi:MAG: radical SAM protein [Acutalibacter sp.]|jgi:biotin synthase